jgi:tight adherence protein B
MPAGASTLVKRAETDRSSSPQRATGRRSRQTQEIGAGFAEGPGAKQKARDKNTKRPPLKTQIRQAGMTVTMERFYLYSAITGVVLGIVVFFAGAPLWAAPALRSPAALACRAGLSPSAANRRVKAFLNEFPNALDVIVRAVKSGLPLNDGIRLIATNRRSRSRASSAASSNPSRSVCRSPTLRCACPRPCPAPRPGFFGIVIQIQQQAGGNLSEALGNLSRVLRDRKKMKAKVQALSMEAKASAVIIGALPFLVAFLVYLSSPNYIMPLFTTSTGHLIIGCSLVWMSIGIFVMRKMMNFEV